MSRKAKPTAVAKVRCAIYTRKSSEEGLDLEFNSLDAQRESSEAFIASQQHEGWVCLPDRYDDGGFSGGSMDRPALNRLLADIAAGKIDCVVVYKVDRLSRSLMDFSRIMETFDNHGASFVSVTQQFNTTHSMGRLTLNILLSFAQFEREISRDHAEINRIALSANPSSATASRLADLHQRVTKTEVDLGLVANRIDGITTKRVDESDITAAFADFDNVWGTLSSREQAKLMRLAE
jgi:site-specific DNA recombinase